MIYQFKHEEVKPEDIREVMAVLQAIRYSREEIARKVLPAWTQPYRAIDKAVILSLESLERDLVAISKTETTTPTTLSDKVKKMAHCAIDAGIIDAVDWSAEIIRRLEETP